MFLPDAGFPAGKVWSFYLKGRKRKMDVNRSCLKELIDQLSFENTEHRSRFSELITCYSKYPFFTRGICKCMYLASWDMEHFIEMLDILNDMTIDHSQDLEQMKDHGEVLQQKAQGYDKYVMELSQNFINNIPFEKPGEDVEISKQGRYIIDRALAAAEVIDRVLTPVNKNRRPSKEA
jgi:hypothetical protein